MLHFSEQLNAAAAVIIISSVDIQEVKWIMRGRKMYFEREKKNLIASSSWASTDSHKYRIISAASWVKWDFRKKKRIDQHVSRLCGFLIKYYSRTIPCCTHRLGALCSMEEDSSIYGHESNYAPHNNLYCTLINCSLAACVCVCISCCIPHFAQQATARQFWNLLYASLSCLCDYAIVSRLYMCCLTHSTIFFFGQANRISSPIHLSLTQMCLILI